MLRHIDHKKMGRNTEPEWLNSYFHFSFAEYYNEKNIHFGALRVWNDDTVKPQNGFNTHPHRDMEIISYVINGELTHEDSMGNKHILTRGQSQYMSAGTGVTHSEMNFTNKELHFLQVWVLPDKKGYQPKYGEYRFKWEERINKWMPIATNYSNKHSLAPIKIHQDINLYVTYLEKNQELLFDVKPNRQAYLVLVEGSADINKIKLVSKDALEIIEESITIKTKYDSAHIVVMEMVKD